MRRCWWLCSRLTLLLLLLLLSSIAVVDAFVPFHHHAQKITACRRPRLLPQSSEPSSSASFSRYHHPPLLASSGNDDTASSPSSSSTNNNSNNELSASTVYFDIEIAGQKVGRLIFDLTNPSKLPLHAENLIQLCKGSRRGIDPKAHYVGCQFDYSPATIEEPSVGMGGRYRWGHSLPGRGRNAINRADERIRDPENQLQCTHACFGGQYYGDRYSEDSLDGDDDPGVFLTVSVTGPGYGSSKFSIVRVRESPKEWGERLLLNAGVIGKMRKSCLSVLHAMARQRQGPPTIVASGVLLQDE